MVVRNRERGLRAVVLLLFITVLFCPVSLGCGYEATKPATTEKNVSPR
jgi:hypothetical protein